MGRNAIQAATIIPSHTRWPRQLETRLGKGAPSRLWAIGNPEILAAHKVALFCSVRSPGNAILTAHDAAQRLRDEGATVVSGFQSPVEKECLRILLRGKQPIMVVLARSMEKIRLPTTWRTALDAGRLLILSPFDNWPSRPTVDSARQRNELVAAMADEVLIIYAQRGGAIERISDLIDRWHVQRRDLDSRKQER
jgi:predicted Rossmann fold nucleotide-binding protein DprA/Smf involved in DNA uptake